jgi:hypothetical protein
MRMKRGRKIETIRLPNATITVWQTASGDLAIEIEPP